MSPEPKAKVFNPLKDRRKTLPPVPPTGVFGIKSNLQEVAQVQENKLKIRNVNKLV
jgi:hypothetical protein